MTEQTYHHDRRLNVEDCACKREDLLVFECNSHPTESEYERVSQTITVYRPDDVTAVIDDTRSTEYTIVAIIDNQYNRPITISATILPDGIVTTNVGIAFSSVDAFCRGFWSVDWFHFSTSANDVTPLI